MSILSWARARVATRTAEAQADYIQPKARYISPGVIEVYGHCAYLQNKFYMIGGAASWTAIAPLTWRVQLRNTEYTEYVVQCINMAKRGTT